MKSKATTDGHGPNVRRADAINWRRHLPFAVATLFLHLCRAKGFGAFIESGGLVVIEAEHFQGNTVVATHAWRATNNVPGFVGTAAMSALPNSGTSLSSVTNSPKLTYSIQLTNSGTFKLWIRAWSASSLDNSVYLGVDRSGARTVNISQTNVWIWNSVQITITNSGPHDLHLWMREDGAYVDRILLAKSLTYTPTGEGPPETIPAHATFRWARESGRIYVEGGGVATLSDIREALPNAPLCLIDPTNRIWFLDATLVVTDGATLRLHGSAVGGDVNELRLRSDNSAADGSCVVVDADWGTLDLKSVKVISWDQLSAAPDTEYATYQRACIRARSRQEGATVYQSRLNVVDSEIAYLGIQSNDGYGLTWRVVGTAPDATVFGVVRNSYLHHNVLGLATELWSDVPWIGNNIVSNGMYGFDPSTQNEMLGNTFDVVFRWVEVSHRIYVTGPGEATLSEAKNALPDAPLTQFALSPTTPFTLVAKRSVWKYRDNGSNQGTAWRFPSFNDGAWPSGPAPLGYGDANGQWPATTNSYGPDPSNKYVTTYYRRSFMLTNPASFANLVVSVQRDDGVVVYLNGTGIFTNNMPASAPIGHLTRASSTVGGVDETTFHSQAVNPSLLVSGVNVLAAEIHQASSNSTDIVFDLELTGERFVLPPTTPFTLVAKRSVWKYRDNGSNQGTAWRFPSFNDGAWPSGPAPLGYGDANGQWPATTNSYGPDPNNKYVTTYYRRSFMLTNPASFANLVVSVQRDDGVVVYLNGTGIFTNNMPASAPIGHLTRASSTVGGVDETTVHSQAVNPSLLVSGINVLTAEIHQASSNSTDIVFDLELTGERYSGAGTSVVTPSNPGWHLGANLFVENGARLKLYGPAIGGDVAELRLKSDNTSETNAFVEIRADSGWLDIRNTRITSWDSAVNGPDTETTTYRRAYVRARSKLDPDGVTAHESRMDVINSEICYLGSQNTEAYGLTWKVVDTTAAFLPPGSTNTLFDLVNVYGDILNSRIHHNHFGVYTYGHQGGQWRNNEVDHNVRYGFDPHDDSDDLVIENNNVHHNGWHGIIASKRCDHGVLRNNVSWNNGLDLVDPHGNGIMLHRSCDDWVVENNQSYGNADSGIAIFACDGTLIRNNLCRSNANAGIRLSVGSEANWVAGNEVSSSGKYGLYMYEGNDPPEVDDVGANEGRCRGNTLTNNLVNGYGAEAIKLSGCDSNVFARNIFIGQDTLLRFENGTNNLVTGNSLPSGTLVKMAGTATNGLLEFTTTTFEDQPRLLVQLDPYSTATFTNRSGGIFTSDQTDLATVVRPTGSMATLTAAQVGTGPGQVLIRNLFVVPNAGSAQIHVTTWNLGANRDKAWTVQGSSGSMQINYRVGDLSSGVTYIVRRDLVLLTTRKADSQGYIIFTSTPNSTARVSYTVTRI